MSPERRPRIPDDLAARIDRVRGSIPFERWVRETLLVAVGPSKANPTVEDYLLALRADMQETSAYDHVASLDEWQRFKKALALWVEEQEREWDDVARDQEHGQEEY